MKVYEQTVTLRVRITEHEHARAPSTWDWSALCDMAMPDAIEVISSGEVIEFEVDD